MVKIEVGVTAHIQMFKCKASPRTSDVCTRAVRCTPARSLPGSAWARSFLLHRLKRNRCKRCTTTACHVKDLHLSSMQGSETRRWPMRSVCLRVPLPRNTWQEGCARPKWHPTTVDTRCPQGTGRSICWQPHPQYSFLAGDSPYSHQSNKASERPRSSG